LTETELDIAQPTVAEHGHEDRKEVGRLQEGIMMDRLTANSASERGIRPR
jgi:hypothetical protein